MRGVQVAVAVAVVASVLRADGLYSPFYAPLLDPRVLGYRVDAPFRPGAGAGARGEYAARWGARGERLVAALGAGGLVDSPPRTDDQVSRNTYGDVNFYYTYSNKYNK